MGLLLAIETGVSEHHSDQDHLVTVDPMVSLRQVDIRRVSLLNVAWFMANPSFDTALLPVLRRSVQIHRLSR